jgi:hypothetical protein
VTRSVKVRPNRITARDTRAVRSPPPPAGGRGPKFTVAFYGTAAWKSLMREIIAKRGRQCQDPACQTPNRARGKRVYGDHVVELKDGGEPLDPGNVSLRCASCHSLKSAEARRQRG